MTFAVANVAELGAQPATNGLAEGSVLKLLLKALWEAGLAVVARQSPT